MWLKKKEQMFFSGERCSFMVFIASVNYNKCKLCSCAHCHALKSEFGRSGRVHFRSPDCTLGGNKGMVVFFALTCWYVFWGSMKGLAYKDQYRADWLWHTTEQINTVWRPPCLCLQTELKCHRSFDVSPSFPRVRCAVCVCVCIHMQISFSAVKSPSWYTPLLFR